MDEIRTSQLSSKLNTCATSVAEKGLSEDLMRSALCACLTCWKREGKSVPQQFKGGGDISNSLNVKPPILKRPL